MIQEIYRNLEQNNGTDQQGNKHLYCNQSIGSKFQVRSHIPPRLLFLFLANHECGGRTAGAETPSQRQPASMGSI
jgi:hypothetical protein